MEDITNNLWNIGKPLMQQEFDIRLTYSELTALKALAQNPHPNYWEVEENRPVFEEIFNDLKSIADNAQAREFRRQEREERSNRVKRYVDQFCRENPFD